MYPCCAEQVENRANCIDAQVIDEVKARSNSDRDELPVDGKSTDEDGGENSKVWSTEMGTQAAISRI